jgi:uncharacterized protein
MAVAFIDTMRAAPAAHPLNAGESHWETFVRLCRETNASGDDIPDAYLAALAIENDCEFVSTDAGLARFSGLRLRRP